MRGADKVIRVCASVEKRERILILTDPGVDPMVSIALLRAARKAGSEAIVATFLRDSANDEPPRRITDLMLKSDVIICPTSVTIYYTNAKLKACKKGARFISMTGATLKVLSRGAIEADFKKQRPIAVRVAEKLTRAKDIHICTAKGTDLRASLRGRNGLPITGLCEERGDSTGFPDIEAFIAPVEDSVEGTVVIDGSISGIGLIQNPVKFDIRHGMVVGIYGGREATILRRIIADLKNRKVYQIAEIGIGLNPKAKLSGAIIEDESALGTAHVALGDNSKFGGGNPAPTHIDNVFRKPVIELDGKRLII